MFFNVILKDLVEIFCGGSWAALQTTEAVVPASLTVNNSEDRQSHCVMCNVYIVKSREGNLPLKPKKEEEKKLVLKCQSYWYRFA